MSEYKSWTDMTALEQDSSTYSDMYKDAYGSRPRGVDTRSWTQEMFAEQFTRLAQIIEADELARKEDESRAIAKFEDRVTNLMHPGTNRRRVIAWLMQADGVEWSDEDHFCYQNGLPYNYFAEKA